MFIEVKYAYRHDVSGCAALYNETVWVTKDEIFFSASCRDQDNQLYFEQHFPFWAEVNEETFKWEY